MQGWEFVAIFALGAAVGFFLKGMSKPASIANTYPSQTDLNWASDIELAMTTLRREIANYLIRRDPDRYVRLYEKARQIDSEIQHASKDVVVAQMTLLGDKFPFHTDFDLIGTREHVLYADSMTSHADEDIEEHFLNVVRFHAVSRVLDEKWGMRGEATNDQTLQHCREYARKIKDTRFRQRLIAAIDDFYKHSVTPNRLAKTQTEPAYENRSIAVFHVDHIAENRYGIWLKDTDEYGIYSFFYDDERDKTYKSYYRSNRMFEAETLLDYLRLDELI